MRSITFRPTAGPGRDRGAVAVEFALLLPVLLLIIFGIIDFGRALNAQITLTQAVREGSRLDALGYSQTQVQTATANAATGLGVQASQVTVTACPANGALGGNTAVVQIPSYTFYFDTPIGGFIAFFGGSGNWSSLSLSAQGEMPCET